MAVKKQTVNASAQANQDSYGKLVYIIGYIILGIGSLYADVMFITLLGSALPTGPLGIAAIMGAFLTSISLLALVIGKSFLFRPGDQITWAWIFTWVEIGVMCLNVIVSALHGLHVDPGYLNYWLYIAPATPFVAVIGWIMLIYSDPRRHSLHEEMAMNDQLEDLQRQHKQNVHLVRLELQSTALDQQKEYMQQFMQSEPVQSALQRGSEHIALGIVAEIIQRPLMPTPPVNSLSSPSNGSLPNGKTIESSIEKQTRKAPSNTSRKPVKNLPRQRRFTPSTNRHVDTEELRIPEKVEVDTSPLASTSPVKVKRNQGTYVVNKNKARIPLND